jgi:uncharacterized protein
VSKIITLILVTLLVVYLFRRMAANRVKPPSTEKSVTVEDMVRCKTCGVNLPRSEALMSRGQFYCCDEHRNSDT